MRLSLLYTTALTAVIVSAQGTGNLSPCIQQCSQQAATAAGCKDITQTSCICASQTFSSTAMQCLQTSCSAADMQAAMGLQQALCAPYTNISKISSVAYAGMTTSTTAAPTSSAAAASNSAAGATTTASAHSSASRRAAIGFGSSVALTLAAIVLLA